jgi:Ca2+-binding RTX toxin-like protein
MNPAKSGVLGGRTRFLSGVLAISALAVLVAIPAGPALAKRIAGTSGADRIVGTKKADRINARGGNDRVKGRAGADRIKGAKGKDRLKGGKGADRLNGSRGKDRLVGGKGADRLKGSKGKDRLKGAKGKDRIAAGKGADRLNAVDVKKDRVVNGGAGEDVCTIDQADLPVLKNCETAKVKNGPGPGPGPGPGDDDLRVTSATGLTCGQSLPLCPFLIEGDGAEALTGSVSGHGGVTTTAGASVAIVGEDWTATGLYGCSADGHLKVTIGAKSVRVPITCT